MEQISSLITAIAAIVWPLIFIIIALAFRRDIGSMMNEGTEMQLEFMGNKFFVRPARMLHTPDEDEIEREVLELVDAKRDLPSDYLYLKHTSRLCDESNAVALRRRNKKLPCYEIYVLVDSDYQGALDRVQRVEYVLHESYQEPYRIRSNRARKFLLKEIAWGEFVLIARVFIEGSKHPLILQRYITLWDDGPKLEVG